MLGAIAGDIIGSVVEPHPLTTKSFPLFYQPLRFIAKMETAVHARPPMEFIQVLAQLKLTTRLNFQASRRRPGVELLKDRSTDELAHNRVVRDQPGVDGHEPIQEGEQAFRLHVFFRPEGNLPD